MNVACEISDLPPAHSGQISRVLYEVCPSISFLDGEGRRQKTRTIVLSTIVIEDHLETLAFPSYTDGTIISFMELNSETRKEIAHSLVLAELGYPMLIDKDPEPIEAKTKAEAEPEVQVSSIF